MRDLWNSLTFALKWTKSQSFFNFRFFWWAPMGNFSAFRHISHQLDPFVQWIHTDETIDQLHSNGLTQRRILRGINGNQIAKHAQYLRFIETDSHTMNFNGIFSLSPCLTHFPALQKSNTRRRKKPAKFFWCIHKIWRCCQDYKRAIGRRAKIRDAGNLVVYRW